MPKEEKKSILIKSGAYAAALLTILTLIFLLFPSLKPQPKSGADKEVSHPIPGDIILGTWQQYNLDPKTSQWQYLGTFVVAKAAGAYIISAREQPDAQEIVNSIGIFDVRSDGTSWSFNSNWGRGSVGNFLLHRVSDTQFDGTLSSEGRVIETTTWVKVQ